MTERGIPLGEEVTITLPAEQWDAIVRGGDRRWADRFHVYDEAVAEALKEAGYTFPGDLRNSAEEAIELATPGASGRRGAVLAVIESTKAEFDTATCKALTKLISECVKAYKTKKRGSMHAGTVGWDHLGHGSNAPGGSCGRGDQISVRIIPGLPHLCINRHTPHFEGGLAWGFTQTEKNAIEDAIVKAGVKRKDIDHSWGGGEWMTYRLKIDHPNYTYEATPAHG